MVVYQTAHVPYSTIASQEVQVQAGPSPRESYSLFDTSSFHHGSVRCSRANMRTWQAALLGVTFGGVLILPVYQQYTSFSHSYHTSPVEYSSGGPFA